MPGRWYWIPGYRTLEVPWGGVIRNISGHTYHFDDPLSAALHRKHCLNIADPNASAIENTEGLPLSVFPLALSAKPRSYTGSFRRWVGYPASIFAFPSVPAPWFLSSSRKGLPDIRACKGRHPGKPPLIILISFCTQTSWRHWSSFYQTTSWWYYLADFS